MYIELTAADQFIQQVLDVVTQDLSKTWLLMFGEKDLPALPPVIEALKQHQAKFFGGIFPGIIDQEQKYESGLVLKALPEDTVLLTVPGLENADFEIEVLPEVTQNNSPQSALVLLDGLTANVATFLRKLYSAYGDTINYMGGGAGSLTLQQQPCVFNQEGIFQDMALVAFIPTKSTLGVKHGWQKIVEPIMATGTDKNVITELNWDNAFDIYKDVVEASSGQSFAQHDFFDLAKGYPFGINKEGVEVIVRDPITVNEKGALVCVGEVPQNTSLAILKGEKQHLIDAAGEAALACQRASKAKDNDYLVFDCISRVLFLEDDFGAELHAVKEGLGHPENLSGALTLGEISSYGEGYIEFFNKTIVVGSLEV
ncbi:MAG TPA: histidine kinase [Microscillaceae bacterium]|nr:histidine kinase [Microscillaceae bacterium]